MDSDQYKKDITFLVNNSQHLSAFKYDGNPDSLTTKVALLTSWKGFVMKFSTAASERAFNVVFTNFLTGSAAAWSSDQNYEVEHLTFLESFNNFFTTANEVFRAFKAFSEFKFACKNFATEYVEFKTLHGCLQGYDKDDRHLTLSMFAALPQAVISQLPTMDFPNSTTLYRYVSSILTNKSIANFDLPSTGAIPADPDAMEIDALGIHHISDADVADIINQYEDCLAATEHDEYLTVELDAIRTRFARSPDAQRFARNCFYCNKPGHFIRSCHKRKADQKARFSKDYDQSKSYESNHRPFRA